MFTFNGLNRSLLVLNALNQKLAYMQLDRYLDEDWNVLVDLDLDLNGFGDINLVGLCYLNDILYLNYLLDYLLHLHLNHTLNNHLPLHLHHPLFNQLNRHLKYLLLLFN